MPIRILNHVSATDSILKSVLMGCIYIASHDDSTKQTLSRTSLSDLNNLYRKPNSTRSLQPDVYSLDKLKFNKRTLSNLKSLKKGWNGYEAEGFPESFILKLEELISELEYQPKIFPTGRGTIQIEYKRDNGDYLEIELNEDSGNVYCERDGESLEKEVPLNRINEQVNEFHS